MKPKPKRRASSTDNPEGSAPVITQAIVRDKAIFLLARREHGKLELRDKLIRRDYPVELVDPILDQLAERGLQCDVRFAEAYTRMRVSRGFGVNKIRADLQSRRLAREIVEDAIAENGADWDDNAHDALLKRFGSRGEQNNSTFDQPDDQPEYAEQIDVVSDTVANRAKMQRFLQSRGYTSAQIYTAIKRIGQTSRT